LRQCDRAEEVRLELGAELVESQIHHRSTKAESRVVDQRVDPTRPVFHFPDASGDGIRVVDIEGKHVEGDVRGAGSVVQRASPVEIPHGGENPMPRLRRPYRGEEPETRRTPADQHHLRHRASPGWMPSNYTSA